VSRRSGQRSGPLRPCLETSTESVDVDRVVIDRSGPVRADALAIRELSERVPVVAFVNNHFEGYAPQTVAQLLAALVQAGTPGVPAQGARA